MIEQHFLDDTLRQFRKLKSQADRAVAQVEDRQLFATLDDESNSIAVIMKHIAGNMRSRWTDLLTTDGEKPDRQRDTEFELSAADTRWAPSRHSRQRTCRRRSTSAAKRTPCSKP
jgi:uncharacterized protein DUF1572